MLEIWANVGLYFSVVLGGVALAYYLFVYNKKPLQPLTGNERFAQPSKDNGHNLAESPPRRDELTKQEQLLENLFHNPLFEIDGKIEAYGREFTIKPKKTEYPVFNEQLDNEQLDSLQKDHRSKMLTLLKKVKPPHKEEVSEDDAPEQPDGGWEEYLENGVPEVGTKKK